MTPDHCDAEIGRLRVLRGMPADVVEYFAALEDVPDPLFTKAITHAIKTRAWFPTPAELRADCDAVAPPVCYEVDPQVEDPITEGRQVFLKNPFGDGGITITLTRDWKFDCVSCEDTGWVTQQCPERYCGRPRREHAPHPYMLACVCIPTNPTIRRRRSANAKFAQAPEKVGG